MIYDFHEDIMTESISLNSMNNINSDLNTIHHQIKSETVVKDASNESIALNSEVKTGTEDIDPYSKSF